MLPAKTIGELEFVELPTKTFFLDAQQNVCYGYTDGVEAMRQAIYLILSTERYQHVIFSWNYGVSLADLFGEPISWVIPEAKRRITEALLHDKRITVVDDFEFSPSGNKLLVSFTAQTSFGNLAVNTEVAIQ